jgi:hypothetical protein
MVIKQQQTISVLEEQFVSTITTKELWQRQSAVAIAFCRHNFPTTACFNKHTALI